MGSTAPQRRVGIVNDSEYTPTTDDLAHAVGDWGIQDGASRESESPRTIGRRRVRQCSRFLAAHDAEVARVAAEKGFAGGATLGGQMHVRSMEATRNGLPEPEATPNPYRIGVEHE